ncbi:MAG TPA: hypothetical protein PK771_14370, partial [Spirochaetota bacterium]|nr:hypothetical protein [Spirochaetota bacterium]
MIKRFFVFVVSVLLVFLTSLFFLGCTQTNSEEETSSSTTTSTTVNGSSTSSSLSPTTTTIGEKPVIELYDSSTNNPKLNNNETLNFGNIYLDTTSDLKKIIIKNSGKSDLSVDLTNSLSGDFLSAHISKNNRFIVTKDTTTDFTICIIPNSLGAKEGKITIKNDATVDIVFNLKANVINKPTFIE